ncbi:NPCBM/NEW2 domain-containing protein [Amycolatopsis sp. DG1A-15b]|uniref:NPCBM/NEW2 domain-containing protein n=1 Tax=Amycolatopsis sp. DG1A-15b TaxID=3052846 RepID=UPI00255BED17|nr:NPCBM/NEW2 domain-containing protein [Amycolatopsis sp. DG1A-15b]WIX87640.1 NPCBM/NEW2 domain-containing protein [Amycolatopsis sp. DG1A-15b]
MRRLGLVIAVAVLLPVVSVTPAQALPDGLALTPPMGFNNWNTTGCAVDERLIRDTADIFVDKGLKAAGYEYVNVDDCWAEPERDADGRMQANKARFPSGIKALADYVHSKGLKFGIYTSAGTLTCAKTQPGALDHEDVDARTFADWGVDYLKYDNCNNQGRPALERYTKMRDALKKTGRPIVYSLCEWGENKPWTWGADVGHLWRTTGDIKDNWAKMVQILKANAPLAPYAGPGHWNDPDMLEVGNGGMTTEEYRSHFSLWAMMAAPLLIGADLRKVSAANFDVLRNAEVIALDQDRRGVQARVLSNQDGHWVFAKPLDGGDVAIALFNETTSGATIGTTAAAAGLAKAAGYTARDLWAHRDLQTAGRISAVVPPHATVVYRVHAGGSWWRNAPLVSTGIELASPVPGVPGEITPAGQPFEVTVSATDEARVPVFDPRVTLTAPGGWHVEQVARPRAVVLGTGETAAGRWRVTPPAGTEGTTAVLHGGVTYRALGFGPVTWTGEQQLTVPAAPPTTPAWASDLRWAAEKNGYGPVERDMSNGSIPAGDGKPLTVNGVVYPKGLGAHAPSEVVFYLGGRCTAFTADVGVDDEREATNKQGSATFEVYADGVKAAATGVRTWQDPALPLAADLHGARYLRLVVTDGGDGNSYDRSDWAAARLTCG